MWYIESFKSPIIFMIMHPFSIKFNNIYYFLIILRHLVNVFKIISL